MEKIWELALQGGPFATVACLIAIGWLVKQRSDDRQAYETSKAGYRKRIGELEDKNEQLQLTRIADYKELAGVLNKSSETSLIQAHAMQERSKTSAELTDLVRELLVHVKLHLSGLGGKIVS